VKTLLVEDILQAVEGRLLQGNDRTEIKGVSTDTRTLRPGELFIALIGDNFDGHSFITEALDKGAGGLIVDRKIDLESGSRIPVIMVSDTTRALQDLAAFYRRSLSRLNVIGITGSVGKTTTKDLLASVLSRKYKVLKTEKNLNNHIGVPLNLLRLKGNEDFAVLEMGMNQKGEIRRLAEIAAPDIGVITNVGPVHLENLETVANVAREKSELVRALPEDGMVVLNYDDHYVKKMKHHFAGSEVLFFSLENRTTSVYADNISYSDQRRAMEFTVHYSDGLSQNCRLTKPGYHNVYNALPACILGRKVGLDAEEIESGLLYCSYTSLRMEFVEQDDYLIINDSYNANPLSVKSSLKLLSGFTGPRRLAVLGDMLELGSEKYDAHREVGKWLEAFNIDILVTVGELMSLAAEQAKKEGLPADRVFVCKDKPEAAQLLAEIIQPEDTILFKGSRGMALEELVGMLKKHREEKK